MSNIDLQYVEAAKRWDAACPEIRRTVALGPAVEPPERKEAYLRHQLDTAGGEILWKGTRAPPVAAEFGLERVIATNDLISFDTLQKAIAVGRFVGMVCRGGGTGGPEPIPLATGSMVSPRLLLTNHHVIGTPDEAAGCCVKFDYQLGEDGAPLPTSLFALRPDEFFVTDPTLDYTLVAVATVAREGTPLAHFGWNRLNATQGKILRGYPVNIIQHPEGAYKQIVLSNNKVLELVDHFFLYEADTMAGSSGAPVFSKQWEIVALHRRSVPRLVDGVVMTKGGQVWNEGIPLSQIDWIGNEGTRVSSLMAHLAAASLKPHERTLREDLMRLEAPKPFLVAQQAQGSRPRPWPDVDFHRHDGGMPSRGSSSFQIDLQLTIRIEPAWVTLDGIGGAPPHPG